MGQKMALNIILTVAIVLVAAWIVMDIIKDRWDR
jgi:hypothetical protein